LLLYEEDQAKLLGRLQLIGSHRCKPVGEVWPETIGWEYRSRSDSHRASPMPRNKVQGYLTMQRNPSVYFTGDWGHSAFFLVAACSFKSSRSVECRVLTSQPKPARVCGKSLCAKTFKSCVSSGDSSTRDQPEPSTTLYIVVRELACSCYHPLHWLRLLTLARSVGHCQCSYIFVSCWLSACNLQVTWIKKKYIVRNNGSLEYIRSHISRAHPLEPELPSAIKYSFNLINIRLNVFLKQWVCIEHWIWIPIQQTVPIPE